MSLNRWGFPFIAMIVFGCAGCSVAPKSFRKLTDPAPIVRARSVGLGTNLPQGRVVPALIDRLEDHDPVVRLAAFQQLKKGTGRSFGFVPWGGDGDRAAAVVRWRSWWKEKQAGLVKIGRNP